MISEADALAKYPGAVSFVYGDSAALNAQILQLVRCGKKTVTCDAVANFARRGDVHPEPGRVDIALHWNRLPVVAVRTLEVALIPFDEMPADLIADQAEFVDLADWRAGYETYLTRAGVFSPKVMMLVERFEVVEEFM